MRRICDHCKEVYSPLAEDVAVYVGEKGVGPGNLVHGRGCDMCGQTKYRGRVGIYELLEMNESIRKMVTSGADETEFRKELDRTGFSGMNQAGLSLVDGGVTSLREFIRTMYDAR